MLSCTRSIDGRNLRKHEGLGPETGKRRKYISNVIRIHSCGYERGRQSERIRERQRDRNPKSEREKE